LTEELALPARPYIGLQYFRLQERALFSGRDADIKKCKYLVTNIETRILLLHGVTGCGKSSFLRAGLIPELEIPEPGSEKPDFRCMRDLDGMPLLIRSGADPIARIAEVIYEYARPAASESEADLSAGRLGKQSVTEFVDRCREPEGLITALHRLSKCLNFTLILAIDQGEEVITLADSSRERLKEFIDFIRDFSTINFPVKCILSLRKDYSGEFIGLSQMRSSIRLQSSHSEERSDVKIFLLRELQRSEVSHAITLPTSFDIYKFEYDNGLPEQICKDLFNTTSSILPIMQIVCRDLYNKARPTSDAPYAKIAEKQYIVGGRVAGPVDRHISSSLVASFGQIEGTLEEEEKGRELLYRLVSRRPDGSVHTEQVSMGGMRKLAEEIGLRSKIEDVVSYLSRNDVLLLRTFSVMSAEAADERQYISLGHDVVGLTLFDWKQRRLSEIATRKRIFRQIWIGIAVVSVLGILLIADRIQNDTAYSHGNTEGQRQTAAKVIFAKARENKSADPYLAATVWARNRGCAESQNGSSKTR
jgi:hypothetical protein